MLMFDFAHDEFLETKASEPSMSRETLRFEFFGCACGRLASCSELVESASSSFAVLTELCTLNGFSDSTVYVRLSSMAGCEANELLWVSLYLLRPDKLLRALSTESLRYSRKNARRDGAQLQMMARFHSSIVQK